MSSKKLKYMSVKEFRENGLLFEVNRLVLHPLGLALSVDVKGDGTESFAEIWDNREDPEGICFAPETFLNGKKKFHQYMKDKGDDALRTRDRKLGYTIQIESGEE